MSKRVAVLVSGGGSNLQAILDAIADKQIDANICVVISSRSDAFALQRAAGASIPTEIIRKKDYADVQAFDHALLAGLEKYQAEYIVLAGYLSILGAQVISAYRDKIINIHPSLIPSFCGMNYYGHHVHEAVLAYGAKVSGATVHFVDEDADTGAIIFQEAVPVLDDDDADALAARILKVEHRLLPKALGLLVDGKLSVEGRKVTVKR